MSRFIGVFVDAWDEVRVHRSRVVLSLIGIVLAVFAMTVTTAAGMIFGQIMSEVTERQAGRDTTLSLYVNGTDPKKVDAFYDSLIERYGVKYASKVSNGQLAGTEPDYSAQEAIDPSAIQMEQPWMVNAVNADYGIIHRFTPSSGRWLVDADSRLLAPSVVLSSSAVAALGQDPNARAPFLATLPDNRHSRVAVVGVIDNAIDPTPTLWVLREDAKDLVPELDLRQGSLELWVPPERSAELTKEINLLVGQAGLDGMVTPPFTDDFRGVLFGLQMLILALSLFALFLGALGVLNVGVVTVRQRVREIGVRRALGASSVRIFCAVMLESVLATMLAGLLGIALAVAVVKNFPYEVLPNELQLTSEVPFPVGAALQAFAAATLVGAIVGLVPATIAVRAKVIDAIRY